jgi:hypothetical protein
VTRLCLSPTQRRRQRWAVGSVVGLCVALWAYITIRDLVVLYGWRLAAGWALIGLSVVASTLLILRLLYEADGRDHTARMIVERARRKEEDEDLVLQAIAAGHHTGIWISRFTELRPGRVHDALHRLIDEGAVYDDFDHGCELHAYYLAGGDMRLVKR